MKTILSLLAVACVGLAAIGCDPTPKDEPAAKTDAKPSVPTPSAAPSAKPSK